MRQEARTTLRELRSLQRFDEYIRIARAELASDPNNDRLRAFIEMIEALVREEKAKLIPSEILDPERSAA